MELPPSDPGPNPVDAHVPLDRIRFYQEQAQARLDHHGRQFAEFVRGHEALVEMGNRLIEADQATGYNLLLREQDMPLASDQGLIFYNNYIGRPGHFGWLLAEMEQEDIITPDDVRFGNKASCVLYGGWPLDPNDEQVASFSNLQVSQTVETIAIFAPCDPVHALRIARKLLQRTDATMPEAISGSWEIPDIRATAVLRAILPRRPFADVTANILSVGEAQLVVARQRTAFVDPWQPVRVELNRKLARYLASSAVLP